MLRHLYLCFVIWRNARTIRNLNAEASKKSSSLTPIIVLAALMLCAVVVQSITSA